MLVYLTQEEMTDFKDSVMCSFVEGHAIYSVAEVTGFLETVCSVTH